MIELTLTVAIPTYNRADKLARLLQTLAQQISEERVETRVSVTVSDNASADHTTVVLEAAKRTIPFLTYYRQPRNLGFDGNLMFLYRYAKSDYIWFMGDDDAPFPGAISEILNALDVNQPDCLLFSFEQPPGSPCRHFASTTPVYVVKEPPSIIEHLARYTKLSIYVLRLRSFSRTDWQLLTQHDGDGWMFLALSFSVCAAAPEPSLVVISKALAGCDDGFRELPWTPLPFLRLEKPFSHQFVTRICPGLRRTKREEGYCAAISYLWLAQTEYLLPQRPDEYDAFARELAWHWAILLRHPFSLLKLTLVRTHVAKELKALAVAFRVFKASFRRSRGAP